MNPKAKPGRFVEDDTVAEQYAETWAEARQQLETARGQLTNPDDEELGLYADFLDHNELGLALDALVDVAHAQRAPGDVWRSLSAAAQTMDLETNDSVHGPGGPHDEYSCLYAPLLERLADGEDAAAIALYLRTELEGHFGLDADYSRPQAFASRLVDWFADGAPA